VVSPGALVGEGVRLGSGSSVAAFCSIGVEGHGEPTWIGDDSTVRSHSVIYRGVRAGARLQTGHHVLIRSGTTLGDSVSIGSGSVVEHDVQMADRVRLHSRCFVPEGSILEEGAWLGPGVVLTNARYPNLPDTKDNLAGVVLRAGATLGAGVIVLPGVVVGAGALVGAGAVVVRDVPAGARIVGNPARALPEPS
jgi:acetyltransferase-like isoleucine patch superfamily enzyme